MIEEPWERWGVEGQTDNGMPSELIPSATLAEPYAGGK